MYRAVLGFMLALAFAVPCFGEDPGVLQVVVSSHNPVADGQNLEPRIVAMEVQVFQAGFSGGQYVFKNHTLVRNMLTDGIQPFYFAVDWDLDTHIYVKTVDKYLTYGQSDQLPYRIRVPQTYVDYLPEEDYGLMDGYDYFESTTIHVYDSYRDQEAYWVSVPIDFT